jgi:NADH:ubiquinone oxidoreductase subunit F (NADH-binding)
MNRPRLLAGVRPERALSGSENVAVHGPLPPADRGLIAEAARAGLRGRGGAAFPVAAKLRAVAAERGPRTVLINAAEGEPMSAKDAALLGHNPHLVLDGALAAAEAVGARHLVVAIRESAPDALAATRQAVAERASPVRVEIRAVPAAYLGGEESALIRHLDGGPLRPVVVPPRPAERGLGQRPTLVNNPETLAHLALIARRGAAWFRQAGTPEDPGTALVTVAGAVAQPGVREIAQGTSVAELLALAGGPVEGLRAVLVGGFHGTWISAREAGTLHLDGRGLRAHSAGLAAGVIVLLGESACPVQELSRTVGWLAAQIAGQCGPCSHGLPAMALLLNACAAGTAPADAPATLARWARQVTARGACRLPDGAARFLVSGLRVFAAEIADHQLHGPCGACARPGTLAIPHAASRAAA